MEEGFFKGNLWMASAVMRESSDVESSRKGSAEVVSSTKCLSIEVVEVRIQPTYNENMDKK